MNKSFNFAGMFKFFSIGAAVIILVGAFLLAIFGGGTFASYTLANLDFSIALKALVAAALVYVLTLAYFAICYKKAGLFISIYSFIGAAVSALASFAFCIICRAPLGDFTFAVVLLGVTLSYVASVLFFRSFTSKPVRKSKKQETAELPYEKSANVTFSVLSIVLMLTALILAVAFIVAMVFASKLLCLYALPAILSAVFSVVFTLSVSCRLYANNAK